MAASAAQSLRERSRRLTSMNTNENVPGESRERVAVVIGYGSIGRRHARTLAALGCSLVIVNRRENVRAQAKLDHSSAHVIDRLEVLDRENFDWHSSVGVIATWGPSHAAFFHMLADRGVRSILCARCGSARFGSGIRRWLFSFATTDESSAGSTSRSCVNTRASSKRLGRSLRPWDWAIRPMHGCFVRRRASRSLCL